MPARGQRLEVPFGTRTASGFALGAVTPNSPQPEGALLKDVLRLVEGHGEETLFPAELFEFLVWTSEYYLHPLGEVLKTASPPSGPAPRARRARVVPARDVPPIATPDQAVANREVADAIRDGAFVPYLLHGVTGSGKTEVYLEAIAQVLALGRSAIILVPEIGMTPQLLSRFTARFGTEVAALHSGLSRGERLRAWQRLRSGEARVAVGVRAAVFAPVRNLGLIIVDEEHDSSFKQEDRLCYHARDMAVARAKLAACPVILGSATPSLETIANVQAGRYRKLSLASRIDSRPLPPVELISLRGEPPPGHAGAPMLRPELALAVSETLERGEQTILFLNRRGHAGCLVCQSCGRVSACPNCDVSMTAHARGKQLLCHYCGCSARWPETCPQCRGPLTELSAGTEKLEVEVRERFPTARVGRLDRDTAGGAALEGTLAALAAGELDVLVGTQLVSKGHDFPNVTLVGVVLADVGLNLPDFRAAERTFQLLVQVAGRAGRGDRPGKVLIQTYFPDHPALLAAREHDHDRFAAHELLRRRAQGFPPTSRLCAVRVDAVNPNRAAAAARRLADLAEAELRRTGGRASLLGPALAPLARLRGRTRYQLLLRARTHREIARLAAVLQAEVSNLGPVRVVFDVDPISML
jgi:primosomal protein N' (replication factor Y)